MSCRSVAAHTMFTDRRRNNVPAVNMYSDSLVFGWLYYPTPRFVLWV